jgi:hypothetical protein
MRNGKFRPNPAIRRPFGRSWKQPFGRMCQSPHRAIKVTELGRCTAGAPSMIPPEPGDRIKTNRRDVMQLP